MILMIESSAEFPSVALVNLEGKVVYSTVGYKKQSHAEDLPMMVLEAMKYGPIQAVAFQEGPGSYTGLRIGVSLAKGLCFANQIPLISVSGFEALGQAALLKFPDIDRVWVMMDARRDEVYGLQLLRGKGAIGRVCAIILPHETVANMGGAMAFVGNANHKIRVITGFSDCVYWDMSPRAEMMMAASLMAYSSKNFVDLAYYEPFYLKNFVAGVSKKFAV